jgi:ATP-binding cassette subfamily B multidrug efflux pump
VPSLLNIRISAISIFKILDCVDEEHNKNTHKAVDIKGKIEFLNVSFRYPSRSEWALKSVSFCIAAGEKAGLVGVSGSGKSTVIQLLLRFYEPNEGRILLDGIDIQ